MVQISAQISLYPLRQSSIEPTIREAVRILRDQGLKVEVGSMSTLVWGEEETVFAGLQQAFHRAAQKAEVVMVVTFSNACPGPEAG